MNTTTIIYNTELFRRYNLYLIKEYKKYLLTIQSGNPYYNDVEKLINEGLEKLLDDNTYSPTDPNYISKVLNVIDWEEELVCYCIRLNKVYEYHGIKTIKTIELFSRIIKLEKLNEINEGINS